MSDEITATKNVDGECRSKKALITGMRRVELAPAEVALFSMVK